MDIKALISKINDRNIQRKRESGFTTYALASVLLLILYKIFDLSQDFNLDVNIVYNIKLLSVVFNMCLGVLFLMLMYNRSNKSLSNVKFILDNDSDYFYEGFFMYLLIFSPAIFFFLLYLIDNVGMDKRFEDGTYSGFDIYSRVYFVFYVILFIAFIGTEIERITNRIKGKTNKYISQYLGKSSLFIAIVLNALFFVILFSICYSIYLIWEFEYDKYKFSIIKIGVFSYTAIFLIEKIISINQTDIYSQKLENFEQEIILNDLKDPDIKKRLKESFLGIFVEDWIVEQKAQLEIREKRCIGILSESNITKKRSKKIKTEFVDFTQKLLKELSGLKNSDNLTDEQHRLVDELNQLLSTSQSLVESYKSQNNADSTN